MRGRLAPGRTAPTPAKDPLVAVEVARGYVTGLQGLVQRGANMPRCFGSTDRAYRLSGWKTAPLSWTRRCRRRMTKG